MRQQLIIRSFRAITALLFLSFSGTVFAQKSPILENVVKEEDGTVYLKNLPDTLVAQDLDPKLTRMGEWMAKYYGKETNEPYMTAMTATIDNTFTTVRGYEKAYDLFKGETKNFGIMINDIYSLNSARYDKVVKDYNRQAKNDGLPPTKLEKGGERTWWIGGIRMELRSANITTLIRSMNASTLRNNIPIYVKREIEKGKPLAWATIFGIGDPSGYYGVRLCIIIGFNAAKEELYYVNLNGNITERHTMSYDQATATTWGLYQISPRSK